MFETRLRHARPDLVAVFLASAVLVYLWHMGNTVLPTNDFATYLDYTSRIYRSLRDSGLGAAISSAYWDRGWRPIFFPALGVPFLAACRADLLCAVSFTMATLAGITGLFAYLIARLFVPSPFAACVVPLIFSNPSWYYAYHTYLSETALIPAVLAAVYFGIVIVQSGPSWPRLIGFALSGAFACLIRPVETLLTLGIPFALWACRATLVYGFGFWSRRDVVFSASIFLVLIAGWWGPFVHPLFSWVFDTSLGTMAQETAQSNTRTAMSMSMSDLAEHIFSPLWNTPPIISGLIAATFVSVAIFLPRSMILIVVGLAALCLPAIALSSTGAWDERRTYGALIILLIGVVASSISSGPLQSIRRMTVIFAATFCLVQIVAAATPSISFLNIWNLPTPVGGGDLSMLTLSYLNQFGFSKGKFAVLSHAIVADPGDRPFDDTLLNLLASQEGKNETFGYSDFLRIANVGQGYELLKSNYDYTLVDATSAQPVAFNPFYRPYYNFVTDVKEQIADGEIQKLGLTPIGSFKLKGLEIVVLRSPLARELLSTDGAANRDAGNAQ